MIYVRHFVSSLNPEKGGVVAYLRDLVSATESSYPQIFLELNYFDHFDPRKFFCGVERLAIKRSSFWGLRKEKNLSDFSRNQIVHNHGLWLPANSYACRLAKKNGCPLITSVHGMLEPWALNSKKIKKRVALFFYERKNLQAANVIHATSLAEVESIRAVGFKNPIAVISPGIEVSKSKRDFNRSSDTGKKSLLFLSRIDPKKGLERLLSIWQRQAKKFPDWELVIAGSGSNSYVNKLKKMTKDTEIDRVRWVGFVAGEEKRSLYEKASIFILPTFSENFGIAVGEALAHGVPVITTNGTPWVEIQDENCGWYVQNSENAIEGALIEAMGLSLSALCEKGLRGRTLIYNKYAWPKLAKDMFDTYRWMLEMGDRPECVRLN